MSSPKPLTSAKLRTRLDPARIPCEDSRTLSKSASRNTAQPRAMQALEMALHIRDIGYNIYLAGEPNLGRTYMLMNVLTPRARKMPVPPDQLYVHNFADRDHPSLILLPAGRGRKLKNDLAQTLNRIRKEIPSRFEKDAYVKKRNELLERFQDVRDKLLKEMDSVAIDKGFNLDLDEEGSLTLYPLIEGKRLSEEEFEKLDEGLRKTLKRKSDALLNVMTGLMRQLSKAEQGLSAGERSLNKKVMNEVLDTHLNPLVEEFNTACDCTALSDFFEDMRADMLENIDSFVGKPEPAPQLDAAGAAHDDAASRYEINLFVDNAELKGAPIILDDHPTPANLLGCIEREAEMGALVTDFTLVKAGALQKANGGFLVLHMEDILQHPVAWEGLMRALRSRRARIEDVDDGADTTKTKGIEPEPLDLTLKVILIGDEEMYEQLMAHDDRFPKLFKIKAHMAESMRRDAGGVKTYLQHIRQIIEEAGLPPFTREAMAGIVDYGSRLIEDQKKLSLKYPLVREIMLEAAALASMNGQEIVDGATLHEALVARHYRNNLYEELFMEEYDRELIKVATSGHAVGHVTGLSVSMYGDFEFGLPHSISCTVGVGTGGIIDLEREAQLGGPIHTKAMMILKSYLLSQFAYNKPLILSGSLCFEQNYVGVEGDSASGAELAALLSALAEVPIDMSLAFTGAVSQSGAIMAVGGVTRKIEGFFDLCVRRGLTGKQGVIIPHDNKDHLMLKYEVLKEVDAGNFAIYPVKHITEALEFLTGLKAGNRRKDGSFTPGSLYHLVDKRLATLGKLATKALRSR
ncbi:Lon protease family protein [Oleidesulfovibrio sp.]|uniref:Lon protease family protein n=1 Tax=Oleidesulfovibrio sp. TaxID=2909707 RepID=UPI003A8B242C